MSILSQFERRLEGAIEGAFSKAFRAGLHPAELATRVLREMESNKTVGVKGVWVPNRFVFSISASDAERFHESEDVLRSELEQVVVDAALERGWILLGPPAVTLEEDDSLRQGLYACEASIVRGPEGWSWAGDGRPARPDTARPGPAELVLIERGQPGRRIPLTQDRVVVGRQEGSDVMLADAGASRRHAELRRDGDRWIITDLGSTNGTLVNERAVGERALEEGDRITIGRTVLEFRGG
jgi:hypothetical protein